MLDVCSYAEVFKEHISCIYNLDDFAHSFVKDYNSEEMKVVYEEPATGRLFISYKAHTTTMFIVGPTLCLWKGCYVSQYDKIALLASPALNGYHSNAEYAWSKDGVLVYGEDTPLYYCNQLGHITCNVSAFGQTGSALFVVSGQI